MVSVNWVKEIMSAQRYGENGKSIVLFDGVCNLCNAAVQFLIRHDPKDRFRFAALQSEAGAELLRGAAMDPGALDSVVLAEEGKLYTRSEAALRLAKRIGFPYSVLYGFIVLPRFLRDGLYDLVARYRYRIFGRRDHCMMPSPELQRKFL